MLYRYSFPMPQDDGIFPVIRYVHSERTPSLGQLIGLFEHLVKDCTKAAERNPNDSIVKHCLRENKACLFALKHAMSPDMPEIESGSLVKTRIVQCDLSESRTQFKTGAIKFHLVNVSEIQDDSCVFADAI